MGATPGTNIPVKTVGNLAILRLQPPLTNPLIMGGITVSAASQNRTINIKETFEASFSKIDKQLDDHLANLKYISSNPVSSLAPSLETVKINDEFERYVKKSRKAANFLDQNLGNLVRALTLQMDQLSVDDYLNLKGRLQSLIKKKKEFDSLIEKSAIDER